MLTRLVPNLLFRFDQQYANRPCNDAQPANQPVGFFKVDSRSYRLRHPVNVGGQSVSPAVEGNHIHAYRNFKWLPWIRGKVAYVPINNRIIVTGEMSGCWLMVFTLNGQACFGHIGTYQDSNHPDTKDAIQAWKIAIRSGQINLVRAFNPVTVGAATPKTFGAVNAMGQLHTIGLDKVQPPPGFPGAFPYKVLHVTQTAGTPMPY